MTENEDARKFLRTEPLLGAAALLLLLVGCFVVLRPFMTALLWAIILAYSLNPLQRVFTRWFRGSRTLAACFVTLTITVMLAGPVVFIGVRIAQDGKDLANATRHWLMAVPDEPPAWIGAAPIVGDELDGYWRGLAKDRQRWMNQLDREVKSPPRKDAEQAREETNTADSATASDDRSQLVALIGRFLAWAREWLIAAGLAVGQGVTQVLLSAFLAFFLLRDSQELGRRVSVAVERLAGPRGQRLIQVAGDTVHGVIYGILGTAIAQALVAGLGFWIAGVPGAILLAVFTFFFAVVPFGPPLIWLPAAFWLFAQNQTGMGIFLLLWGLLGISSVDNILRPLIISQGSKMPFALIFCGVIGGALGFGLVGVFLGPTLLAVAYRLTDEWSTQAAGPTENAG
ncbi:MAG: AI-2E family transporter [Verrucomicrobia bacterium]|nr:AI-2E family transporter [Verrucomicrobiota bacterium]